MTDTKKPDDTTPPETEITLPETPAAKAEATRVETKILMEAPQLPAEFVSKIQNADMTNTDGLDLKEAALQHCDQINVFLRRISSIPELSETVRAINQKLSELAGAPLYEQLGAVLEEFDSLSKELIAKITDGTHGADYLLNTGDAPNTPRVDLEKAIGFLENMRPLHSAISDTGLLNKELPEREDEVQKRMKAGDTQYLARFKMQRELIEKIDRALENGEINRETARQLLFACSGQFNMAFNVVGQRAVILRERIDENDLGYNEAEKQFVLLELYWQLMGVSEGVRYLKRFYR